MFSQHNAPGSEPGSYVHQVRRLDGLGMERKHKLEISLVEQIVRLYATHPGVDADGIMTKMGL